MVCYTLPIDTSMVIDIDITSDFQNSISVFKIEQCKLQGYPHPLGIHKNIHFKMFTNPILDGNSADPAVIRLGEYYYMTLSEAGTTELTIYKSKILTDFRNAEKIVVYTTKNGQSNLWAPEMHLIDGHLYIYFCMDGNGKLHRNYVIQAISDDPFGEWSEEISLMPEEDGIDGTVMKHGDGKLYYIWASGGWLFLSRMFDPLTIGESRLILRKPTSWWELQGQTTNEGPFVIYKNGVSFLIFSASFTFEANYCLGMMSIEGHRDPMVPSNWWYGNDYPVFWRNDDEDVYAPGHASFTVSPDGSETWMVYHAASNTTHINGFRIARLEKIEWDENGYPVFPRPHGFNHPQAVPSGQLSIK
ncbi:unnamed protein product [Allacma fusca]|uniref:Uncharacterized protein n=1 Tax=Allacma fusca TaxID=39272 RepID=A0A8J2PJ63_9HEXA|nr:unnamed protein product [Allacma fusca]